MMNELGDFVNKVGVDGLGLLADVSQNYQSVSASAIERDSSMGTTVLVAYLALLTFPIVGWVYSNWRDGEDDRNSGEDPRKYRLRPRK